MPGQPASITGERFSRFPEFNRLLIDGVQASVTQASPSELRFVVPSACGLAESAVPVWLGVGTAPGVEVQHPVQPSFLSLAVGQEAVTQGCIQFNASDQPERYVIGVQSLSETVASEWDLFGELTTVKVEGVIPDEAMPVPALAPAPMPSTKGALRPMADRMRIERWERHLAATAAAYERERPVVQRLADRGRGLPSGLTSLAPSVPGNVREGDELSVRIPVVGTCADFTTFTVRVRQITSEAIFVEDTANPVILEPAVFTRAGVDFEQIHAVAIDYFGRPGDMDRNGRIVIVVTKEVNRGNPAPLGFVSPGNLLPKSLCAASNEGEYFYMRAPDPTGQLPAGVYPVSALMNDFPILLAHEFTHIIQHSRRLAVRGQLMVSWLAEGLATGAQEVVGFAVLGLGEGGNYGRTTIYPAFGGDQRFFFRYLDDLIAYFGYDFEGGRVAGAPERCGWIGSAGPCSRRNRLRYGLAWSLIKQTIDRDLGGPSGQRDVLRRFSDYPGPTGFSELEAVLGLPVSTLLAEWAPIFYLDDRNPATTGFQHLNWNLRDIAGAWQTPNAELLPRSIGFGSFTETIAIAPGSSAYYELSGATRPPMSIRVRDQAGYATPAFIQTWVVRVE